MLAVGCAIAAAMLLLSLAAAGIAWRETPDTVSFRQFAEPQSTKFEGKSSYLYGLPAMQVIWFLVAVFVFPNMPEPRTGPRKRWWPIFWACLSIIAFAGTWTQASRSLIAAGHGRLDFAQIVRSII